MRKIHLLLALAIFTFLGSHVCAVQRDDEPSAAGRTISEWLGFLQGEKDFQTQQRALLVLGLHGTHDSLWTKFTNRRRAGIIGASLVGPAKAPEIVPAFSRAMQTDPSPIVRLEAARALGRIGKTAEADRIRFDLACNALIDTLRTDGSPKVREAAAIALGQVKPLLASKGVGALIERLSDDNVAVRNASADTLRRLKEYAEPALPSLIELVKNSDAETLTRMQAALAIGQIGGDKAIPGIDVLRDVVVDKTTPEDVRVTATESLGFLLPESAKTAPALAKILIDPSEQVRVRRTVATTLDRMGSKASRVLPQLLQAFQDEDRFVRGFAMHTVSQMKDALGTETKKVVDAYLQGIDDSVLEVRITAIESLGALGKEGLGAQLDIVQKKLEALKRDSQPDIRAAAINADAKLK